MKDYKEFYQFAEAITPWLTKLWTIYNKRKDPVKGMKYVHYIDGGTYENLTFDRIEFDPTFERGTKFNYIFYGKDNNEVIIPTITHVNEGEKITAYESKDLYSFWQCCYPLNEDDI